MNLSTLPLSLCKPAVFIAIAFTVGLSSCSTKEPKTVAQGDAAALQSASLVEQIHAQNTDPFKFYTSIQQMPLAQIAEIHTYFNIERWNSAKNQDKADDELYEAGAKALKIPVTQLKEADDYYLYKIMRPLDTAIRTLYRKHANLQLPNDSYLKASAWAGMHTLNTRLVLYAGNNEKEIKALAASLADSIAATLPAWITGVKFTGITRKDTLLQTSDEIDAGFIWRRGMPLTALDKKYKGFGKWPAATCTFWDNPEWNNQKKIAHPTYKTITAGDIAAAP